jgi:hypothetical protein
MTYAGNQISADRLIESKGQSVILTRRAAGAYNVATGAAAITSTTQTGKGVIFDFARGLRKMEGSTILAADRQLLLSALNSAGVELTPPQVDDIATIGGTDYTITEVSPLSPGGTAVLYDLTVRGAP